MQDSASDHVTVLVFKDNYASRTFQIPLRWFARFGLLLGLMAGLTLLSLFFALKYYQVAKTADPGRVHDLEEAIADLKARSLAPAAAALPSAQVPARAASGNSGSAVSPVGTRGANLAPLLFNALPPLVTAPPANPNAVPIAIHAPSIKLSGKSLTARFELQYMLLDKGSQQGRILLLARGPSTLLSYPAGAINAAGKESLIDPEKGEYFSVSRIRAVSANFGAMPAGHEVNQLEVLILSSSFQVLLHQIYPVEGAMPPKNAVTLPPPPAANPAPAAQLPAAAAPPASGSNILPAGVAPAMAAPAKAKAEKRAFTRPRARATHDADAVSDDTTDASSPNAADAAGDGAPGAPAADEVITAPPAKSAPSAAPGAKP